MLEVRRLRLLTGLARYGTIARVAEVVGYTPSAVSQALSQLEREAGVTLLERDGRSVRLTGTAQRLVARAERVLAELDAAQAELAADHDVVRGAVAVGAFASAAAHLVAPALRHVVAQHPDLDVSVHEQEPEPGIALLRTGALDILVSETFDDVPPAPTGGLEHRALMSEPLLLVVPIDHPTTDPVRLADLANATWVAGRSGTQFAASLDRACRAAGFAPRVAHRAEEAAVQRALVAAGLAVAMLPALACVAQPGVRYIDSPGLPRRHVTALMRRGTARRPAVTAVLDAVAEHAQPAGTNVASARGRRSPQGDP